MSCSKMKVLRGCISLVMSTRLQPEDIGQVHREGIFYYYDGGCKGGETDQGKNDMRNEKKK